MAINSLSPTKTEDLEQNTTQEDNSEEYPAFDSNKAKQARAEKEATLKGYTFEKWQGYPDDLEGIDENEPDIDGVPQTLWRGERLFIDNIDEVLDKDMSTKNYARTANRGGEAVYMSRDKYSACTYAVGTDGVKWYDGPLSVDEIPIGVVYKINNSGNHLGAVTTEDEPIDWGPFAGKFQEFITSSVPSKDYEVVEFYIMDDFIQPNGHKRSDVRQPMEVFKVLDQSKLPDIIEAVKKRMKELDSERDQA